MRSRKRFFTAALLAVLAALSAPPAHARPDRILNVVAACDDEFRLNNDWQSKARAAIDEAGATLTDEFGIRLNLLRYVSWSSHSNEYDLAALHDELIEDVPAEDADLVIGFTGKDGEVEPRRLVKLGHSDTPGSWLVVTDRAGSELGLVLLHEIGHAFGLPHVRVPSVMNEQVHPDRVKFDSVCAAILRNNRDLEFRSRDPFAGCRLQALQALYDQLAARGDDVAELYAVLGDSYRRRGETYAAEEAYRKAADMNPSLLNPRLGLGMIAMYAKRWSDAVRYFEEARGTDPGIQGGDMNLGLAYEKLGMRGNAIAAYRRAIAIDRSDANAMNNLALLYMDEGDDEEAETALLDALQVRPGFCEAHSNLGLLYRKMKHPEQAARAFEESLKCRETPLAHRNLASALLDLGRNDEALRHIEASLRLDPDQKDAAELRRLAKSLR